MSINIISMGVQCTPGEWSAVKNPYPSSVAFNCPENQVLAGVAGVNWTFRFRCCSLPIRYTWINAGNRAENKKCPDGQVIKEVTVWYIRRNEYNDKQPYQLDSSCAPVKKALTTRFDKTTKKHCYNTRLTNYAFSTKSQAEKLCEAFNDRFGDVCLGVYDPSCDGRGYWFMCQANRPLFNSHSSCVYQIRYAGRRREETAELDQLPAPFDLSVVDDLASKLGGADVSDLSVVDFGGDDIEDM